MKNALLITCLFFLSISHVQAQDKLQVALKDATPPDVYIDGKQYNHAIIELLDQSKIESVNVLKGEQAIKKYNAPNGVIIVRTKNGPKQLVSVDKKEIKVIDNDKEPLIIIDGKTSNQETLTKLSPDDVETINVFKGEQAMKEYNAPNGVVVVKTKKK